MNYAGGYSSSCFPLAPINSYLFGEVEGQVEDETEADENGEEEEKQRK